MVPDIGIGLYVVVGGGRPHMEVGDEVGRWGARGDAGGSAGRLDSHCGGAALHSRGGVEAMCHGALALWVDLRLDTEPAGGELVLLQGGQDDQCSRGNLAAGTHVRPWTMSSKRCQILCGLTLAGYQAVLGSPATYARFQKSAFELGTCG